MGDLRRMEICEAWAAVYGLQGVGLRTLRFFVNCWRAADVYEWPPVQAYRNPAPVSGHEANMGELGCMGAPLGYGRRMKSENP